MSRSSSFARPLAIAVLLFLSHSVVRTAQPQSRVDANIGAIHFRGPKHFTAAQVSPIIGIPIGSAFDQGRPEAAG
jgi:hypothetical protein